jgi:hypothetical protein
MEAIVVHGQHVALHHLAPVESDFALASNACRLDCLNGRAGAGGAQLVGTGSSFADPSGREDPHRSVQQTATSFPAWPPTADGISLFILEERIVPLLRLQPLFENESSPEERSGKA